MSVSVENTSNLGRRLQARIPNEKLQQLLKSRMLKLSKEVRLKGFRPGKVPMTVIQKQFGQSVRQEVISELIEQTLKDTFTEQNIKLAGRPTVENIEDKTEEDLSFSAIFEVFPEIELSKVEEIEIERKEVDVTEQDIDNMISKLCRNMGEWVETEDPVEEGFRLKVDFARKLETADEEENQKDVTVEVGHHSVVEGLSEKLIGSKLGDTVETEITYPDYWAEEEAKGKKAKLKVTIKEMKKSNPLKEEDLSEKLGLKEYEPEKFRTKIKDKMSEEVKRTLDQGIQEDVLEILLEKNTFELPQSLIDQEISAIDSENQRKQQANMQQPELSTEEKQDSAEKRVKLGLLINEVIAKYKIKVDGQLLRKEVEYLAQEFGNPEEIVNLYFSNQQLLSGVERVVLLQQAVEALLKDMKVTPKSVTFDEIMNPKKPG